MNLCIFSVCVSLIRLIIGGNHTFKCRKVYKITFFRSYFCKCSDSFGGKQRLSVFYGAVRQNFLQNNNELHYNGIMTDGGLFRGSCAVPNEKLFLFSPCSLAASPYC